MKQQKDIFSYRSYSNAAIDYKNLVDEFLEEEEEMSINSILEKRNKFQQAVETTSNFDFKFYGIEDETTRNELLQKEEIAKRNIMQIQRNTIELGKILYETQELLANHKNGAFNGWFLNLGLKKDFVYREIQRYENIFKIS